MRQRVAVVLLLAPLSIGRAQLLSVTVRDSVTAQPVIGAVVRLIRDTTSLGQSLTNGLGHATIRAPEAGEYRLRIQRIGYRPFLSAPIKASADALVNVTIRIAASAVSLETIQVQSKTECGRALDDRGLAGALWSQIQTALTANVVTNAERAPPMRIRSFRREVGIDGKTGEEIVTNDAIVRGEPFASPDVRVLLSRGYAYLINDEMTFNAPDAKVFVSEEFVSTHCFSALAGSGDSLVGLSFTPLPRRRQSDVRGTLWVNRSTSELRSIEYYYTNLPVQLRDLGLGGVVKFARLPEGEWVVSYWHIRMPVMAEAPQDYRTRVRTLPHLASYVETGGRAMMAEGTSVARAVISGVVTDTAASSGVAGAVIRLVGMDDSVVTDSAGRFRLATDKGGPQVLMATHPKLGIIDDGSQRDLLISLGDTLNVDFAIPRPSKIAANFCGPITSRSGVVGLAAISDIFTPGLDVRATWTSSTGVPAEERAQSGPRGLFLFCDLPSGIPVKLQFIGKPGEANIRLSPGEYLWVELRVPR